MTLRDLVEQFNIQGKVNVKICKNDEIVSVLMTDDFESEYKFLNHSKYMNKRVMFMYCACDMLQIELEDETM